MGIILRKTVANDVDDNVVRHELARVDVALRLQPGRRLLLDGPAENVAGGNLRNIQCVTDALRLRTLAGAGRSKEDDIHPDAPSYSVAVRA